MRSFAARAAGREVYSPDPARRVARRRRRRARRRANASTATGRRGDRSRSPGRGRSASSRAARRVPPERTIDRLTSWTVFGEDATNFSGTATLHLDVLRPSAAAAAWQIDLGQVRESARVRLNGRDIAALIGPQFRVVVDDASSAATNVLEVSVTNLSANRIRDLDRRGVPWKKFYNVNFPPRLPAEPRPRRPVHRRGLGPARVRPSRTRHADAPQRDPIGTSACADRRRMFSPIRRSTMTTSIQVPSSWACFS